VILCKFPLTINLMFLEMLQKSESAMFNFTNISNSLYDLYQA
jgi:hypothetical protein